MPRIDRGTIGRRLFLIGCVTKDVMKGAVVADGAEVKLADGIAHTIARVGCTIGIASVGRFGHPDSYEPYPDGACAQTNGFSLTFSVVDHASGKRLPRAPSWRMNGIVAGPELHDIMAGKRVN